MTRYYAFLRGNSNAHNVVNACVWTGEARSLDEARKKALGVARIYNNQYLEILTSSALRSTDNLNAVREAEICERCDRCNMDVPRWQWWDHYNAHLMSDYE